MDTKIERLIDGASELSKHFNSEDWSYWRFPKEYINTNIHLRAFLEKNKDIEVISLFKKDQAELKPFIKYYKVPLVKIDDDNYEVHDSARSILYNFCLSFLMSDFETFCANVRASYGILRVDHPDEVYSYPYHVEFDLRKIFLKGVDHPRALYNVIGRSFHIRNFSGGRQFLNLNNIGILLTHSEETYDYSNLLLE